MSRRPPPNNCLQPPLSLALALAPPSPAGLGLKPRGILSPAGHEPTAHERAARQPLNSLRRVSLLPTDEDFGDSAPAPASDPFGDEDESSEEEWDKPVVKKAPAKAAKPKTKLELAIEAREARERAAAGSATVEDVEGETPEERKARLEQAMKDADLEAAMDAMGGTDSAVEEASAAQAERLAKLDADGEEAEGEEGAEVAEVEGFPPMDPSASLQDILPDTEEEFGVFLERLAKATKIAPTSEHLVPFMKEVLSRTFTHLEPFEIKPVTEALSTLHKEKMAEQRAADGKKVKKNTKASSRAKLGNNAVVSKKPGKHSHTGQDNDIRFDKYDDYDSIADRY